MSITEFFAVGTSLLYLLAAIKRLRVCWLFGGLSNILYGIICLQSSLYAETILQLVYLLLATLGWFKWKDSKFGEGPVFSSTRSRLIFQLLATTFLALVSGFLFSSYSNAFMPFLDSSILCYSLLATMLTIERKIENWMLWIVIDIAATYLYYARELYLSSGLYLVYTLLCIPGYMNWKKTLSNQETHA